MNKVLKRLFVIVSLAMILSVIMPTVSMADAAKQYYITVKFTSAKLLYNHHVGNTWDKHIATSGSTLKIKQSKKVVMKDTDQLSVVLTAIEKDSSPDIGTVTYKVNVSALKTGTSTVTQNIIVYENKGRYKGSDACWKYTITITKRLKS